MSENNKQKILYILDIMKKTDEFHPLNTTQIAEKLLQYGINAERKSIARDIQCLDDVGYYIMKCENHNDGWYMTDQDFEDYELKMLVDAVAAAKFLTIGESRKLIKKLKKIATKDCERIIDATMVMDENLKIKDSKFNIKFDTIMRAIADHKQIQFQYIEREDGNEKELRYNGYVYQVSPYFIALENEEYFLICNPNTHNHATCYRIELMTNVDTMDELARPMCDTEDLKDIGHGKTVGDFLRQSVHMWGGTPEIITLQGTNSCRINLKKTFGNTFGFRDEGSEHFIAKVNVVRSEGFYQWLAGYGANIKITSPEIAIEEFKEYLQKALNQYN